MEESGSVDDDLKNFRNQWRREIEESQQRDESHNESSREQIARQLFLEGIELERSRKYFEAIKLYRRAVQLEPNIEYKVYQATLAENEQKAAFSKSIAGSSKGILENAQNENDDEDDIDFNLTYNMTGMDYDWRWVEQWLPHAAWYLLAVSLNNSE